MAGQGRAGRAERDGVRKGRSRNIRDGGEVRQSKERESKAGQGRASQVRCGRAWWTAGQGKAGQGRSRRGRTREGRAVQAVLCKESWSDKKKHQLKRD